MGWFRRQCIHNYDFPYWPMPHFEHTPCFTFIAFVPGKGAAFSSIIELHACQLVLIIVHHMVFVGHIVRPVRDIRFYSKRVCSLTCICHPRCSACMHRAVLTLIATPQL